jgi:hypothetical protein
VPLGGVDLEMGRRYTDDMNWKRLALCLGIVCLLESVALVVILKTYEKRPRSLTAFLLRSDGMCRAWGREWRPVDGTCRMADFPHQQAPNLRLLGKP